MAFLKRALKRAFVLVGVPDHYVTPRQLKLRLLRGLHRGHDGVFRVDKSSFVIQEETRHAFAFFARDGVPSPDMAAFLRLAKGKKRLLDVGALYGVYSLVFTGLPGAREARAIEPSPAAYRKLCYHAERNGNHFHPYHLALGEKDGALRMRYNWVHLEIVPDTARADISVPLRSLDTFVQETGFKPDLIKIDVEGSEYAVLKGGARYLRKHKPSLLLEVHPAHLETLGVAVPDLLRFLRDLGYGLYTLEGKRLRDSALEGKSYTVIAR